MNSGTVSNENHVIAEKKRKNLNCWKLKKRREGPTCPSASTGVPEEAWSKKKGVFSYLKKSLARKSRKTVYLEQIKGEKIHESPSIRSLNRNQGGRNKARLPVGNWPEPLPKRGRGGAL